MPILFCLNIILIVSPIISVLAVWLSLMCQDTQHFFPAKRLKLNLLKIFTEKNWVLKKYTYF